MTVRIATECSSCGTRPSLPVRELELWHRPDGCEALRFHCPACGRYSFRCATPEEAGVLLRFPVQVFDVPAEALEASEGPPLSPDDLIDLRLALASDEPVVARATLGDDSHGDPGTDR